MSAPSSHLHSTSSPSADPLDGDNATVTVEVEVLTDGSSAGQLSGRSQPPESPAPPPVPPPNPNSD
ncbi:MAG TPA: hypothetical protein IGS51_18050, partial [Thermoleptolyngbya sp. M55_K2018_002]